MKRLSGVTMVVAAIAATSVGSVTFALANGEDGRAIKDLQDYSTPPEQKFKVSGAGAEHKLLKVFRRARGATDELLGGARLAIETRTNIGENVDDSRKALQLPSGYAIFLVPAEGEFVGVYDNNGSGGVKTQIQSGRSAGVDICAAHLAPGFVRFHGELPDDAEDVVLIRSDGSSVVPVVGDNAWAFETPVEPVASLPRILRFHSQSGESHEVELHVPTDLTEGRCVDRETVQRRIAESKQIQDGE
jgi:hypothetical protein